MSVDNDGDGGGNGRQKYSNNWKQIIIHFACATFNTYH